MHFFNTLMNIFLGLKNCFWVKKTSQTSKNFLASSSKRLFKNRQKENVKRKKEENLTELTSRSQRVIK